MVKYEKPTVEKSDSPISDSIERHPAYAQVAVSHVTGRAYLYGSDFEHQNYIVITIRDSELHRGLSRDWPHAGKEYIEVALSEAQWASLVASPNRGDGVQCTLGRLSGQPIPQIPVAPKRQEQFKTEAAARLQIAIDALTDLKTKIENAGLGIKQKKDLLGQVTKAEMNLTTNIDFMAKQFGEHMETITEHAKIEIDAHIQAAVSRAGLSALQGQPPIRMPSETGDASSSNNGGKEHS